ncbi:unnamed protein product [Dicrocoelium dendriticum]|nr:unnamed protein product [Dicrocoelium dendriticum]
MMHTSSSTHVGWEGLGKSTEFVDPWSMKETRSLSLLICSRSVRLPVLPQIRDARDCRQAHLSDTKPIESAFRSPHPIPVVKGKLPRQQGKTTRTPVKRHSPGNSTWVQNAVTPLETPPSHTINTERSLFTPSQSTISKTDFYPATPRINPQLPRQSS